jgi:hypothetical protein
MSNLKIKIIFSIFLVLIIVACSNNSAKEVCHISTGGSEYRFPDFTKEECLKEVQSYHEKGIIDAKMSWKAAN